MAGGYRAFLIYAGLTGSLAIPEVHYVVTRRGAPSLVVAGFGYVARKRRGTRVYWCCRSRRSQGCRARAVTRQGRLLTRVGVHAHEAHDPLLHRHAAIESLIETVAIS